MIVIDRALTLWQPWASLMAIGAKKNETRGRRTAYRGWIAIHAAKSFDSDSARATEAFADVLRSGGADPRALPLGAILCVVRLVDCVRTEAISAQVPDPEFTCGNYESGRWAYLTKDLRQLRHPVPGTRGFQTIPWRLKVPILESDLMP